MKWEYKHVLQARKNHPETVEYLNRMGDDRWELIQIESDSLWTAFYFKRVKDESNIKMC